MAPDRHSTTEMHRSLDDATGDPITIDYAPLADGAGGVAWGAVSTSIAAGTYELANEGGQDVIQAHGTLGATEACDPTLGNIHTGTLDANCTITLSAPVGSGGATLEWWLTEDGTGGWSPTFAATGGTFTWDGTTPTFTTTAGTTFRVVLERVPGTTNDWVGDLVGGGGSALTVKDEGTPLATAATSLDFVGAGVVASGATAAKTITIAGVTAAAITALGFVGPILMTDGTSAPPVPMTTEDGTDYLYMDL